MQPIDRLCRTIRRQPCDRPPVVPQIFAHAAKAAGLTLDDYVASSATAARCQAAAWRAYGGDAVFAVLDLTVEPHALGGEVTATPGIYPAVSRPPLAADADFTRLPVPDPREAGRMPQVLEMVSMLRTSVGQGAAVIGLVQGPMTLAVQFLGMEAALFLAADQPERFLSLLDFATRLAQAFGEAQLAAGADVVMIFDPAACPEVVPAGLFREMLGPRVSQLCEAFRRAGALANWLHVAGRSAPIIPYYSRVGVDIGNVDYCIDLDALLAGLGDDRLCLDGTVKPLSFVVDRPDDITVAANSLLARFHGRGGFILSSGCEIPPEALPANVAALVAAAQGWRGERGHAS
ncbi:MAG: uroporphyrinogen decarboxylase family protein [Actinomycetota bacterium]